MKRIVQKIGDVYCVPMNNSEKKYFQYIADDMTMLNSRVIRAFKKAYPTDCNPELFEIINDEIDFYAHVVIKLGRGMNLWEKIGNTRDLGSVQPLFRVCDDDFIKVGEQMKEISEKWRIWRVNELMKFVGKLEGEDQKAEIGLVMDPLSIVERMQTGIYNMAYPGYDKMSFLRYDPSKESDLRKEFKKRVYNK